MSFDIFPILPKFLFSVRKSEFDRFDGGVPGAGPLPTCLDLFCWFGSSKGDLSDEHG